MKSINPRFLTCKTNGSALLLFMFVLFIVSLSFWDYILPRFISDPSQNQTTAALNLAKKSLLAYAASHYYRTNNDATVLSGWHAYLPCPEATTQSSGNEGNQANYCSPRGLNALGRLPWKSLRIPPLKDASGQCLWYAVSAAYKQNPKFLHNADSPGMFDIYDINGIKLNSDLSEDRIVAVIIAPGAALPYQQRGAYNSALPCGYPQAAVNPADFLDRYQGMNNALIASQPDSIDTFISTSTSQSLPAINDRIITLRQSEVYSYIYKQTRASFTQQLQTLGSQLLQCLANYARNAESANPFANANAIPRASANASNHYYRLPWPAAVQLTDYRANSAYTDQDSYAISQNGLLGRFPFLTPASDAAIPLPLSSNNLFSQCPELDNAAEDEFRRLWEDWKDYFFLVIASDFSPDTPPDRPSPSAGNCNRCPSINGRPYAAILIIANLRLAQLDQLRRSAYLEPQPQNFSDLKDDINNYLEGSNASNYGPQSQGEYGHYAGLTIYNDILLCLSESLEVTLCSP